SLKDDLRYTPSTCFLTFPFAIPFEQIEDREVESHRETLEAIGRAYDERRAALMVSRGEGLTATYNRFHDPGESDPAIEELRALHAEMDRRILAAYGFGDIPTACSFLLDYEAEGGGGRRGRGRFRYRFPDDVEGEVLARLIELNARRADEECG